MKYYLLFFVTFTFYAVSPAFAQSFNFKNEKIESLNLLGNDFKTYVTSNPTPNEYWAANNIYTITASPCQWSTISTVANFPNNSAEDRIQAGFAYDPNLDVDLKLLRSFVKLEVLYDDAGQAPQKHTPFVYLVAIKVACFSSYTNCTPVFKDDTLMISYLPDGNYAFQDKNMKSYYGFYSIQVQIRDVYDITDQYYNANMLGVPKDDNNFYALKGACAAIVTPGAITSYTNGWRTIINNNPACNLSVNWKLTAGIDVQQFVKTITPGIPQNSFYANDMANIELEASHTVDLNVNNVLHVDWKTNNTGLEPVPAMYELEWTYVDNYKVTYSGVMNQEATIDVKTAANLSYDFEQNATRVITDKTFYDIPLIYKRGYVVYRVRLVRPDNTQYKLSKYSEWSLPASGTISSIPQNNNVGGYPYYLFSTPHVADNINWNYQISYAEQGKNKNVISYFDGLLKSRQSLTKFGSVQNQIIATEPVYNFEGGVGLQSLPIPIIKNPITDNLSLTYQKDFLIADHTLPTPLPPALYTPADIDAKVTAPVPPLDVTALAFKYYSPSNPLLNIYGAGTQEHNIAKAIPDAEAYPFVQTIQAEDDPKRVKMQGGAGKQLQIGETHETKFYYMDPLQTELNQYLGLNGGFYKFYEKTVTRDPNKQLSFSISNNLGKPVMTGLMQKPTPADAAFPLVQLDKVNPANATVTTTDVLYGMSLIWEGSQLKFNKTYMNEGGDNSFIYGVKLDGFVPCSLAVDKINVPLTLEAVLKDEEINQVQSMKYIIPNASPFILTPDANKNINYTVATATILTPEIGEVVVDYKISYKQEDVETGVDNFLAPYLQPQLLANINQLPCIESYNSLLATELDELPESCVLSPTESYSECAEYEKMMKDQLVPGSVYAKYEKLGSNMTVVGNDTSLFKIVGWINKLSNPLPADFNNNTPAYVTHLDDIYGNVTIKSPNVFTTPSNEEINFMPTILPDDNNFQTEYAAAVAATAETWREKWGIYYDKVFEKYQPVYLFQLYIDNMPNQVQVLRDLLIQKPEDLIPFGITDNLSELVKMHPEYCMLGQVYCETEEGIEFIDQLENINTYDMAADFNLETLAKMADRDPLKAWYGANYNSHLIQNIKENDDVTYTDVPLDHYACLQTYIKAFPNDLYEAGNTNYNTFFTNVGANVTVINQNLYTPIAPYEDTYYKTLRTLYLGARRKIALGVNPLGCVGTYIIPHLIAPSSIFRSLINGPDGPTAYQPTQDITDALATYATMDPLDDATVKPIFAESKLKSLRSYASNIVNQLRNCMTDNNQQQPNVLILNANYIGYPGTPTQLFPTPVGYVHPHPNPANLWQQLENDFAAFMNMNIGSPAENTWKGGVTPDAVRNILKQRGVNLDDLCNPYLISYERSTPETPIQDVCDISSIWKIISELNQNGTNFLHEPLVDIMDKVINQGIGYTTTGSASKTLHASGHPNTFNKFEDLIHYSLGMSGSNTYTITAAWGYSNENAIGNVENLSAPLQNAAIANGAGGGTNDVRPAGLTYDFSSTVNPNKHVTFTFTPIHSNSPQPVNGFYICNNGDPAVPCAPTTCGANQWPFALAVQDDFIELNKYLKLIANSVLVNNGTNSLSDHGNFYFYECNPDFTDGKVRLKVMYVDDYRATPCPWIGYIYTFDLTIGGLDLSFLNQHDCITAYEFKRDYEEYKSEVVVPYALKGSRHPFYEKTVQNFYNFNFMKKHEPKKYMDFLEGAHLAKYQFMPDYYSYVQAHSDATKIGNLINWATSTYTVTGSTIINNVTTTITIFPAKNIEYFRYSDNTQDHVYFNLKSIKDDETLRKFLIALKAEAASLGIAANDYNVNMLQNELPSPLTAKQIDVFVNGTVTVPTIANVTHTSGGVTFKYGALTAAFTKHTFVMGAGMTEQEVSDAIYEIRKMATGDCAFVDMGTNHSTTNLVNTKSAKHVYLDQAYGISPVVNGQPLYNYNTIVDLVKKAPLLLDNLGNGANNYNAPSFLSYLSPATKPAMMNVAEADYISGNLYLAKADALLPNSHGKLFLIDILTAMKTVANNVNLESEYKCNSYNNNASQATTGSIFYKNSFYSGNGISYTANAAYGAQFPTGASYQIKPRRQEGNIYWFKIKGVTPNVAGNVPKYYNVYIKIPDHIPHRLLGAYAPDLTANNIKVISHKGGAYGFTINFTAAGNNCIFANSFTAYGVTDFLLDNSTPLVLETVMLCDYDEDNGLFDPCFEEMLVEAENTAKSKYAAQLEAKKTELMAEFNKHIQTKIIPKLTLTNEQMKFALTLYGYDRAGNLIYTVPPEGVDQITAQNFLNDMDDKRKDPNYATLATANVNIDIPEHIKKSNYVYNSLNQLTAQSTPDGGETKFYYDPAGKVAFSQNAKQAINKDYSYTLYDNQNRIIETGQVNVPGPTHALYDLINCLKTYNYSQDLLTNSNGTIRGLVRIFFRREVVCTYYDEPLYEFATVDNSMSKQENLRSRVATIATYPALSANTTASALQNNFTVAQHYSYDLSGNVKTLTYDMPQLNYLKQRYKRIDYDYDLYSGKVNLVSYNRGFTDQYYQQYDYDDDNRITKVKTSQDGLLWDNDADYQYYAHGPLARVTLGDLTVQGIDFAYTLQGWLKSINGDQPKKENDIGGDGLANSATYDDKLQHTLYFYNGDYKPINLSDADNTNNNYDMYKIENIPAGRSLYNGNISSALTTPGNFDPLFTEYWYDQLNRIKKAVYKTPDYSGAFDYATSLKLLSTANANASIIPSQNNLSPAISADSMYRSEYNYDLDGNLTHLRRFGVHYPIGTTNLSGAPQTYLMDKINYYYNHTGVNNAPLNNPPTNRLLNYSEDATHSPTTSFENDLRLFSMVNNDPNVSPRFEYDQIGNLIVDKTNQKELTHINWTLYGKIASIDYGATEHSQFLYEPGGNRFRKTWIKPINDFAPLPGVRYLSEYYIRDASGNILAIYKHRHDYKMENPYVDIMNGIKTAGGFATGMAAILGDNDEFAGEFMTALKLQQNTYFNTMIAAKTPSYYLENSAAIKNAMVVQTASLLPDLLPTEPGLFTAVLHIPNINIFSPLFIESDEATKKSFITLLTDTSSSSLTMMQNILYAVGYTRTITSAQEYVDKMYTTLTGSSTQQDALKNYFAGIDTTLWHQTLLNMLNDSLYVNKSYTSFSYQNLGNFVRNMTGQYGNTSILSNYYAAMGSPAETVLANAATAYDRSMVIFDMEPADVFEDMKTESWFADIADEALSNTSNLSFASFADMLLNNIDVAVDAASFLHPKIQTDEYYLAEHHLYGSSRLGIKNYWPNHYQFLYDYSGNNTWANSLAGNQLLSLHKPWFSSVYNSLIGANYVSPYGNANIDPVISSRIIGLKHYELNNHLGNVMTVVTDKIVDSTDLNTVGEPLPALSNRKASVFAAYDYYPFGMLMPNRYAEDTTVQCTPVTKTVYTTHWFPVDMKVLSGPTVPVEFSLVSTGTANMSMNTANMLVVNTNVSSSPVSTELSYEVNTGIEAFKGLRLSVPVQNNSTNNLLSISLQQINQDNDWESFASTTVASTTSIEIEGIPTSNTAVKVVFSGIGANFQIGPTISFERHDLLTSTEIVTICNSNGFIRDYRFGFNGQHKDNEIAGTGNHNTALFWEYDTRLGRRWNVDPVIKPWRSPYDAFSNNPIIMVDPDGDDDFFDNRGNFVKRTGKGTQIIIMGVKGINKMTDINFNKVKSLGELHYKMSLISKIGTYYGKQVGVNGTVGVEVNSLSLAHTSGNQVNISIDPVTGKPLMNDYRIVKNVMKHEKGHQEDYDNDIANNRKPNITFEDHVSVYVQQFNDASFKDLDEADKVGMISNAVGYALNSINEHKDGSDRISYTIDRSKAGKYTVINDLNDAISKYGIKITLNNDKDVKQGYKIDSKGGTRSYDFKENKDAH